jgi:hypothetical protein
MKRMDRRAAHVLYLAAVLVALALLAACAAGQQPSQETVKETVVVVETQVVEGETVVQEVVVTATPEPAVEAPAAEATSLPTQAPLPTQPPAALPTAQPTQESQPSPTAYAEQRMVELEYPTSLRLGDSDIIRLALIPYGEDYQVTTDFGNHQTDTNPIDVQRPAGYDLEAEARLDGVGFEIAPSEDWVQALPVGEQVTWRWSLTPRNPGQQRLTVMLLLRWVPQAGTAGVPREAIAFSRGLNVDVISFFGLTRGQAMTGGMFGLLFGGGLALFSVGSLVRPRGALLQTLLENPQLALEPKPGLQVDYPEAQLLRTLFGRYARLVLESEFLSGYSGARTFLAQPVRADGRADAYTIVKVGQRGAIQHEFENYETYVKDRLPPITARIQRAPVTVRGSQKAALQYTFIAEPGRMPTSLRLALLQEPDPTLLDRLFETFGPNWWMQRRSYTFRLAQEYDRVLPTHYVISPERGRGQLLDGHASSLETNLAVGELVTLRRFAQSELRADGTSLSLRGTAQPGQPPLRVRWLSTSDPQGATGRVVATRQTLLAEFTQGLELLDLPDPLLRLPALLAETVSGTQSTIHGDLNLENILTGPGGFVWLIDFAETRDGHTLFDFAHLEAEVITHVVAAQQVTPAEHLAALRTVLADGTSQNVPPVYALLSRLYTIAGRCLFNPSSPREYQLALTLSCLGALKFANLQANQKQLLYLTAAVLGQEL